MESAPAKPSASGAAAMNAKVLNALRDARVRIETLERERNEPIAIIGMACRLPGEANTPDDFWRLLQSGRDAIVPIPYDRWRNEDYYSADLDAPGKLNVTGGGFITLPKAFDAEFFGVAPREAVSLDPQQRLILEVTWEALESAGLASQRLNGQNIGVFAAICWNDYGQRLLARPVQGIDAYMASGVANSMAAGRLSHALGLHGPSLTIDTACSSSLVAVHLACQSLRNGECTAAIVGAASQLLHPGLYVNFTKARMLSPDSRCKTFAADANGFVRSEGAVTIVLKRLADARADGDEILGLILGSAVNHDGHTSGLTVPNGPAQQDVIRKALRNAGVKPADVGFIEAHGTGTPLGDPIEVGALGAIFGEERSNDDPLVLGAVKSNIGHLEAAAGLAGLLKVVLAMRHAEIPPNLHFHEPNPHIAWNELPFVVPTRRLPWSAGPRGRVAGISSFGFSGTNGHVVLSEAPADVARKAECPRPLHVLALSARSEKALTALAAACARQFSQASVTELAALCHSINTARPNFQHRLALTVESATQAASLLDRAARAETDAKILRGYVERSATAKAAFLFTGQGSQYAGMGGELYRTQPVFKASLDRCAQLLAGELDAPLLEVLFANDARIDATGYTQPALFCLEYALANLWISWGIRPEVMLGHSVGEYAAACVAEVFSLEDALRLIAARGRLMQALPAGGAMLAVMTDERTAARFVEEHRDDTAIAAINGPTNVVLSGAKSSLDRIAARFAEHGIKTTPLVVSHAFHSPLMRPMLEDFAKVAQSVRYSRPRVAFISNVTGAIAGEEVATPDYWVNHIMAPVRFAAGVQAMAARGCNAYIEIGPKPVLLGMARQNLPSLEALWLPSLRSASTDWQTVLSALGALHVQGFNVDWRNFDRPYELRRVMVPTYPFERREHWVEVAAEQHRSTPLALHASGHDLLGERLALAVSDAVFSANVRAQQPSYLADHVVAGRVLMPATGFVEMMLKAGRELGRLDAELADVLFVAPLPLESEATALQVVVRSVADGTRASVHSRTPDSPDGEWTLHASAAIRSATPETATFDPSAFIKRASAVIEAAQHYGRCAARGIEFGESFRGIKRIWRNDREALAYIERPASASISKDYVFHPVMLDACLQAASVFLDEVQAEPVIPLSAARVVVLGEVGERLYSHAVLKSETAAGMTTDVAIYSEQGVLIALIEGFACRRLSLSTQDVVRSWMHHVVWRPMPAAIAAPRRGVWLVVAPNLALVHPLVSRMRADGLRTEVAVSSASVDEERSARTVDLCSVSALTQWMSSASGEVEVAGIVYCGHLDSRDVETALVTQESAAIVLALAQARAALPHLVAAPLFLLSRGLHSIRGERTSLAALADASAWGLGRVIAREQVQGRCVRIDLDPATTSTIDVESLVRELLGTDREDEIALRGGQRYVARLEPLALGSASTQPMELAVSTPGSLDHLIVRPQQRRAPLSHEVEIEVRATGLGFRDVLNVLGMYPGGPVPLGCECAGVVSSVGEDVADLKIGDEVLAVAYGSFASFVTVPAQWVVAKPAQLSFEQAAALPSSFLTAHYTLNVLAGIQPGQRVLIHAGTGGVGQAAIQVAQQAGAEIFATAGSPEKRAYLTAMGVQHVLDSRSLEFADAIRRLTGGRGVDVVLNSLAGEFLTKSFEVLAEDGCFIEIGKRDLLTEADAKRLKPRARYFIVDLGALSPAQPELVQRMLGDILEALRAGRYRALPMEVFGFENATDAFRYMAQAKHIGKIVLAQAPTSERRTSVRSDAMYLVTGGLGALGLSASQALIERGAKHLALLGRREPGAAARQFIERMSADGVDVRVLHVDVADEDALAHVLDELRASGPALRGIFHAAGVLDDGTLDNYPWRRFERVLAPKVRGAWNLHRLTQRDDVDSFVLFGAAAGLLGLPGQGAYAAANVFLDALAQYRRSRGQAALTVDWGAWSGDGMAASEAAARTLQTRGLGLMTPQQGTTALWMALAQAPAQIAVLPIDWRRFHERLGAQPGAEGAGSLLEALRPAPRLSATSAQPAPAADFLTKFTASASNRRQRVLSDFVIAQVRKAVGLPDDYAVDERQPLQELGLDSLMAVELRNELSAGVKFALPATFAFDYPTAEAIARYLLDRLLASNAAATVETPPTAPATPASSDAIEDLSDDEAAKLLFQELADIKNDVGN